MVDITIPDKLISNSLKIGGVLIVLVMVATLIKPSITGNVVGTVNELKANLTECTLNLKASKELSDTLQGDVANITSVFTTCSDDIDTITNEKDDLVAELANLKPKYETLVKELNQSENDYKELAEIAARGSCCSRKFAGEPDINSYDVIGNVIKCKELNSGEYTLECS